MVEDAFDVVLGMNEGRESGAEFGIDSLQNRAVISGHLLKESHDEGVAVVGGLLVERDVVLESLSDRDPGFPYNQEQRCVRGLPSQQEGRYAPLGRSYHLRRHVEVVGDPDALSLCLSEGDHGERIARAWKPLYDDLGPPIHQQVPVVRPQPIEVVEQERVSPDVAPRPFPCVVLCHLGTSNRLLVYVDAVPRRELLELLPEDLGLREVADKSPTTTPHI